MASASSSSSVAEDAQSVAGSISLAGQLQNLVVAVRARPALPSEREEEVGVERCIEMSGSTLRALGQYEDPRTFIFDHCFSTEDAHDSNYANQYTVFEALGSQVLQNAWDGYNATIFAYGQTGSGKTYTMMGDGTSEREGLVPRTCRTLFEQIKRKMEHADADVDAMLTSAATGRSLARSEPSTNTSRVSDLRCRVEVSYFEIYNERVFDLLRSYDSPDDNDSAFPGGDSGSGGNGNSDSRNTSNNPQSFGRTDNAALRKKMRRGSVGKRKSSTSGEDELDMHSLRIREHPKMGPYVEGAVIEVVESWDDMLQLLQRGSRNRATAETQMNAESSRSHAIFAITFTQTIIKRQQERRPPPQGTTAGGEADEEEDDLAGDREDDDDRRPPGALNAMDRVSQIHMVDLAGSERVSKTGASGQRLKESGHINRSLTTLGSVINTLSQAAELTMSGQRGRANALHIPYRNSKLTWLLKESLGGNAKTIMVATISPLHKHYEETMSTLRYAERAKSIHTRAVVNEDPNVLLIRQLRLEIDRLHSRLKEAASTQAELQEKHRDTLLLEMETREAERRAQLLSREREITQMKHRKITELEQKVAALTIQNMVRARMVDVAHSTLDTASIGDMSGLSIGGLTALGRRRSGSAVVLMKCSQFIYGGQYGVYGVTYPKALLHPAGARRAVAVSSSGGGDSVTAPQSQGQANDTQQSTPKNASTQLSKELFECPPILMLLSNDRAVDQVHKWVLGRGQTEIGMSADIAIEGPDVATNGPHCILRVYCAGGTRYLGDEEAAAAANAALEDELASELDDSASDAFGGVEDGMSRGPSTLHDRATSTGTDLTGVYLRVALITYPENPVFVNGVEVAEALPAGSETELWSGSRISVGLDNSFRLLIPWQEVRIVTGLHTLAAIYGAGDDRGTSCAMTSSTAASLDGGYIVPVVHPDLHQDDISPTQLAHDDSMTDAHRFAEHQNDLLPIDESGAGAGAASDQSEPDNDLHDTHTGTGLTSRAVLSAVATATAASSGMQNDPATDAAGVGSVWEVDWVEEARRQAEHFHVVLALSRAPWLYSFVAQREVESGYALSAHDATHYVEHAMQQQQQQQDEQREHAEQLAQLQELQQLHAEQELQDEQNRAQGGRPGLGHRPRLRALAVPTSTSPQQRQSMPQDQAAPQSSPWRPHHSARSFHSLPARGGVGVDMSTSPDRRKREQGGGQTHTHAIDANGAAVDRVQDTNRDPSSPNASMGQMVSLLSPKRASLPQALQLLKRKSLPHELLQHLYVLTQKIEARELAQAYTSLSRWLGSHTLSALSSDIAVVLSLTAEAAAMAATLVKSTIFAAEIYPSRLPYHVGGSSATGADTDLSLSGVLTLSLSFRSSGREGRRRRRVRRMSSGSDARHTSRYWRKVRNELEHDTLPDSEVNLHRSVMGDGAATELKPNRSPSEGQGQQSNGEVDDHHEQHSTWLPPLADLAELEPKVGVRIINAVTGGSYLCTMSEFMSRLGRMRAALSSFIHHKILSSSTARDPFFAASQPRLIGRTCVFLEELAPKLKQTHVHHHCGIADESERASAATATSKATTETAPAVALGVTAGPTQSLTMVHAVTGATIGRIRKMCPLLTLSGAPLGLVDVSVDMTPCGKDLVIGESATADILIHAIYAPYRVLDELFGAVCVGQLGGAVALRCSVFSVLATSQVVLDPNTNIVQLSPGSKGFSRASVESFLAHLPPKWDEPDWDGPSTKKGNSSDGFAAPSSWAETAISDTEEAGGDDRTIGTSDPARHGLPSAGNEEENNNDDEADADDEEEDDEEPWTDSDQARFAATVDAVYHVCTTLGAESLGVMSVATQFRFDVQCVTPAFLTFLSTNAVRAELWHVPTRASRARERELWTRENTVRDTAWSQQMNARHQRAQDQTLRQSAGEHMSAMPLSSAKQQLLGRGGGGGSGGNDRAEAGGAKTGDNASSMSTKDGDRKPETNASLLSGSVDTSMFNPLMAARATSGGTTPRSGDTSGSPNRQHAGRERMNGSSAAAVAAGESHTQRTEQTRVAVGSDSPQGRGGDAVSGGGWGSPSSREPTSRPQPSGNGGSPRRVLSRGNSLRQTAAIASALSAHLPMTKHIRPGTYHEHYRPQCPCIGCFFVVADILENQPEESASGMSIDESDSRDRQFCAVPLKNDAGRWGEISPAVASSQHARMSKGAVATPRASFLKRASMVFGGGGSGSGAGGSSSAAATINGDGVGMRHIAPSPRPSSARRRSTLSGAVASITGSGTSTPVSSLGGTGGRSTMGRDVARAGNTRGLGWSSESCMYITAEMSVRRRLAVVVENINPRVAGLPGLGGRVDGRGSSPAPPAGGGGAGSGGRRLYPPSETGADSPRSSLPLPFSSMDAEDAARPGTGPAARGVPESKSDTGSNAGDMLHMLHHVGAGASCDDSKLGATPPGRLASWLLLESCKRISISRPKLIDAGEVAQVTENIEQLASQTEFVELGSISSELTELTPRSSSSGTDIAAGGGVSPSPGPGAASGLSSSTSRVSTAATVDGGTQCEGQRLIVQASLPRFAEFARPCANGTRLYSIVRIELFAQGVTAPIVLYRRLVLKTGGRSASLARSSVRASLLDAHRMLGLGAHYFVRADLPRAIETLGLSVLNAQQRAVESGLQALRNSHRVREDGSDREFGEMVASALSHQNPPWSADLGLVVGLDDTNHPWLDAHLISLHNVLMHATCPSRGYHAVLDRCIQSRNALHNDRKQHALHNKVHDQMHGEHPLAGAAAAVAATADATDSDSVPMAATVSPVKSAGLHRRSSLQLPPRSSPASTTPPALRVRGRPGLSASTFALPEPEWEEAVGVAHSIRVERTSLHSLHKAHKYGYLLVTQGSSLQDCRKRAASTGRLWCVLRFPLLFAYPSKNASEYSGVISLHLARVVRGVGLDEDVFDSSLSRQQQQQQPRQQALGSLGEVSEEGTSELQSDEEAFVGMDGQHILSVDTGGEGGGNMFPGTPDEGNDEDEQLEACIFSADNMSCWVLQASSETDLEQWLSCLSVAPVVDGHALAQRTQQSDLLHVGSVVRPSTTTAASSATTPAPRGASMDKQGKDVSSSTSRLAYVLPGAVTPPPPPHEDSNKPFVDDEANTEAELLSTHSGTWSSTTTAGMTGAIDQSSEEPTHDTLEDLPNLQVASPSTVAAINREMQQSQHSPRTIARRFSAL